MNRDRIVGRTLGGFIVRERIGEGGFGVVYRAEQPLLGRDAVIKVLRAPHRRNQTLIRRFLREARLASRLDHPFAAHIYDSGAEPDGVLWIAMELVRGTPFDRWLALQGPLSLDRFVPFLERICEVIQSAHEQGLVHRDVKPANVMVLSRAGRLLPKLLDFGVAKLHAVLPDSGPHAADDLPSPALIDEAELETPPPSFTLDEPSPFAVTTTAELPLETRPLGGRVDPGGTTANNQAIGSPFYMAPEQWMDATAVDARTDLYALGVLCYEALSGRVPFDGESLQAIYRAHAEKPVPSLGPGFPAGLDGVLARVLAKKPSDRYASALEFAAAFRTAAGHAAREHLPQLDEPVRVAILADAPQPLAEAVASLDGARNVHQARQAVWEVLRAAARFVGVVALACRTRTVPDHPSDTQTVVEALRTLYRRSLSDEEWIDLARDLCLPFAARPEVHPLPELVAFFCGDGEIRHASPFAALLALHEEARRGASAGEDEVRGFLDRAVPELSRLLGRLAFLSEYRLAVTRDDHVEGWMGVRRQSRTTIALRGQPPGAGQPFLVDRDGCPVVALWPLAQVAPPTPGAPDELFLVDGKGSHGARLVALPSGFERQDAMLWDWFGARLLGQGEEAATGSAPEQAPYLGLASFTPADAALFFGREREVEAFTNRLKVQPLVAVVGPSGAGKSSFVQAGLIPALPDGWRVLTVRPGSAPIATLGARLAREGISFETGGAAGDLRARLAADPELLARALRAAVKPPGVLVLVVDQFEELLTLCGDPEERALYAEALSRAARSAEEPVRVVLTLRDDFLLRAERLPGLRDRLARGLQLLTTPAPDDLLRILVEPARRAGYDFEDRELPSEMVRDVADRAGALALLSFTAARLWEARDRSFRQLRRKAYRAIGGVGGALAQHAEETLAGMLPDEQRLVRELFRRLVTAEGTRAAASRGELVQVLGNDPRGAAVVERLIAARLLVVFEGEGTALRSDGGTNSKVASASDRRERDDRVEVIHEALLSAWPRLVDWRHEDAEGARLRDQLREATHQWEARGRARGLLWRDDALAELRLWRARHPGALTGSETDFIRASLDEATRIQRRRFLALAVVFVALASGVVELWRLNQRSKASAKEAHERVAELYEEQGRQALLDEDPMRALVFLNQAYQDGKGDPALRFLVARAAHTLDAQLVSLDGHSGRLWTAAFSPDGTRALTAGDDRTARVWDSRTGRQLFVLDGHGEGVWSAEFSHDGRRIVTASWDHTARLWDAQDGRLLHTLAGHDGELWAATFSPDGARVVTASLDRTARVWDTESGRLLATLAGHTDRVKTAAFSPDGTRIVTAGADRTARLWDAGSGRLLHVLAGHTDGVQSARFSPDGARIVTASFDRTARIWDVEGGRPLQTLEAHALAVTSAAFSPDGTRIVTASWDKSAKVWSADAGKLLLSLDGHTSYLTSAAFSPDGHRIVTTSIDGTARIWDASGGHPLQSLFGHLDGVRTAAFDASGTRLLTASHDGTAKLWRASRGEHVASLVGHRGAVRWVSFTPDGERVLTTSDDRTAKLWDARTGRLVASYNDGNPAGYFPGDSPVWLALFTASRDGTLLAVPTENRRAAVVEAATGRTRAVLAGHTGPVRFAAFSPDASLLVTTSEDFSARVWRTSDGAQVTALLGHTRPVSTAAFRHDGARVVTAADDRTARIWDVPSGRLLVTLAGSPAQLSAADFNPDGTRVVTAGWDHIARVWDAETGALLVSLEGHAAELSSAAFSPDGARIVTAGNDNAVMIWDAATGKRLASFRGPDSMEWAAFSPDGTRVVAAGDDHGATIWDVATDLRTRDEVAAYLRCHVPYRLDKGRVVRVTVDISACPPRAASTASP